MRGCLRVFVGLPSHNYAARQLLDRLRASLRRNVQQLRQTHKVVGRSSERKHPAHPCGAIKARLALTAYRLHPAEHFLDALTDAQAYGVAPMTCGAAINRRTDVVGLVATAFRFR